MKPEDRQQFARIVATDGQRESDLSVRIQRLRQEVRELESFQSLPLPSDAPKATRDGASIAQANRIARIGAIKDELVGLEAETNKLIPTLAKARKALKENEAETVAERRTRCAQAVEKAAAGAPSRPRFFDAREKLVTLRKQLVSAEAELHGLLTDAPAFEEAVEARALRLLEGGPMQDAAESDVSRRVKNMNSAVRTLIAAVRMQEARVSELQGKYCSEIGVALKPLMQDVVGRIAAGMETARGAVTENGIIRTAVAVATGGHTESLPCFTYSGVQVHPGGPDGFTYWLDTMRREGFAV